MIAERIITTIMLMCAIGLTAYSAMRLVYLLLVFLLLPSERRREYFG